LVLGNNVRCSRQPESQWRTIAEKMRAPCTRTKAHSVLCVVAW